MKTRYRSTVLRLAAWLAGCALSAQLQAATYPLPAGEDTVIGEVQSPTSHLFSENFTRDDYIQMSGGLTQRADKSRIYVVRADGSVVSRSGNAWFGGVEINPGDTIVVPLDAERMRPLPLWTAVTTIIYNLAVAVAAVNSF